MEDEKQLRILNQLFIPLSQAMPALANTQDVEALRHASAAMQYIIQKQIELSGSSHAMDLKNLLQGGDPEELKAKDERIAQLERMLAGHADATEGELDLTQQAIVQLQQNQSQITETLGLLLQKLGVQEEPSASATSTSPEVGVDTTPQRPTVVPASA
jgi:hypothetical protein